MPHVCPSACSRLATAAVFISVGVVQFVVGIILLRSNYVYLLAGPDFWTSFFNITVGCFLGITASVWKRPRKRQSKKHKIRRNFVLALLFSGLLLNISTLGILILGEGNTMMSIRLESSGMYTNRTFVSEILAYAYATSVCSPIVCIVVSIVAIAGNCFEIAARRSSVDLKISASNLKKDRSQSLQWVYTPELLSLSKKNSERFSTTSSESDEETSEDMISYKRNASSVEELQSVFNRMAQGKRDSILSDSAIMLRQLELRRKNKHSTSKDDSSLVHVLPQTEIFSISGKKRTRNDLTDHDRLLMKSRKCRSFNDSGIYLSSNDIALKPLTYIKNKHYNNPYKRSYNSDEELNEYQNASSQLAAKNFSTMKKNLKQNLQTGSETDIVHCYSDDRNSSNTRKSTTVLDRKLKEMAKLEADLNDLTLKQSELKRKYESFQHSNIAKKQIVNPEIVKEVLSPELSDCFSPEESEFGEDSFDMPRRSSWAGDIIPINVNKSPFPGYPQKLIPVQNPVVPNKQEFITPKLRGAAVVESKCKEDLKQNIKEANLSSFREDVKFTNKENSLEYPKTGSQSIKKHDFVKMSMMASISEEPNAEIRQSTKIPGSACEETGATPKVPKGHLSRKSLISAYSESSKEIRREGENQQNDITPNRKMSASCKTLRRIWSSVGSEKDADFMEQVVDEDSLIGLSEEELIARQFRNRSIRKALQQRLKNEIVI